MGDGRAAGGLTFGMFGFFIFYIKGPGETVNSVGKPRGGGGYEIRSNIYLYPFVHPFFLALFVKCKSIGQLETGYFTE